MTLQGQLSYQEREYRHKLSNTKKNANETEANYLSYLTKFEAQKLLNQDLQHYIRVFETSLMIYH